MDAPEVEKAVDSKQSAGSKKAEGSKQAVRSRREMASIERKGRNAPRTQQGRTAALQGQAGALVDLGFLSYRKRTITPPIKPGKRANK
jgi:hypothetical protein